MENFVVSARKYRPDNFNSVVGQMSITSTLKNAIRTKHIAQAYLFCGPRGVGKTTCARILAKTINCLNLTEEVEACNQCESCKSFNQQRSYNIHELDAASNNSVDDIRTLIEQVRIPPQVGKYSIYIIDEVHMLSQQAFNAFLKTLEEPPKHAIFILATTEKHKILPTILSRCQIFDFSRITINDAVQYLEYIAKSENVQYELDALNIIAQKADGGMRDALSIFDQIVSFSDNHITYKGVIDNLNVLDYEYYFKLVDAILAEDTSACLLIFNDILDKGFDAHNFINGLASHLRDLLVCKDVNTIKLLEVGDNIKQKYAEQSKKCEPALVFEALKICSHCDLNYKQSKNKRLHVEFALIELSQLLTEKKNNDNESGSVEKTEKQIVTSSRPVRRNTNGHQKPVVPEPVNMEAPKSVSLKEAFKKTAAKYAPVTKEAVIEQTEEIITGDESTPCSKENLTAIWKQYLENIKPKTPRIYASFINTEIDFEEASLTIKIPVNNNALLAEFESVHKSPVLVHLKRESGNSLLKLEAFLQEDIKASQRKRLYTVEDKFQYMSEKNPAMLTLKQQLNLDFE